MSLQSMVDNFVDNQKREKGTRTYETYGRKIYVFQEYIEQNKVDDITHETFLYRARMEDILSSVMYYVQTYDIKYKSTADSFFAALSVFFNYIQENHGIKNDYFAVNDKIKELKDAYAKLAEELGLNDKEQALPLTDVEYTQLVQLCNEKIDGPTDEEVLRGKNNGVYTSYISSIVIKFVLLFGTRNRELSEIMVDDYNRELNKITIRKYSVHLPDGLAKQMKRYAIIRDIIASSKNVTGRLFVDISSNQQWENAKMYSILRSITQNTKATSVAKYAIVQMLKNGLPSNLVMDFTGYSKSVCGHCQELIDEENGILNMSEKNRRLDTVIRQSRAFDDL